MWRYFGGTFMQPRSAAKTWKDRDRDYKLDGTQGKDGEIDRDRDYKLEVAQTRAGGIDPDRRFGVEVRDEFLESSQHIAAVFTPTTANQKNTSFQFEIRNFSEEGKNMLKTFMLCCEWTRAPRPWAVWLRIASKSPQHRRASTLMPFRARAAGGPSRGIEMESNWTKLVAPVAWKINQYSNWRWQKTSLSEWTEIVQESKITSYLQ